MTKQECAIVEAYTGIVMLNGKDTGYFYRYANELMGRPVYTHELADRDVQRVIKEMSRPDFIRVCRTAVDVEEGEAK